MIHYHRDKNGKLEIPELTEVFACGLKENATKVN